MAEKDLEKHVTGGALTRPDFIETSTEGTEGIEREDIKLPRLAIAQGLSPQMTPGDPAKIDGLQLFDFFNDLSGEIYSRYDTNPDKCKPVKFIVVRRDVKFIEFDPNDRKVPLDLEVPRSDSRTKWSKDPETGKGIPPRATKFVEFIVLLIHPDSRLEPVVISIQETNKWNKKAHERLSGFIKNTLPPAPIYAKIYSATPALGKNDKGTFGVFQMNQVSFIHDKELYSFAKNFHDSLVGKTIVVDRAPGDDTFDVESMESDGSGM